MNKLIAAIVSSAFIFTAACSTTPVCVTSSLTPLEGKKITENLGEFEGRDSAISVLSLFMIGRPDTQAAINEALNVSGGDTLVNVRCYLIRHCYVLFATTTVMVQGNAVKVTDTAEKPKGGR
jgi:hypothetical protein